MKKSEKKTMLSLVSHFCLYLFRYNKTVHFSGEYSENDKNHYYCNFCYVLLYILLFFVSHSLLLMVEAE